MTWDDARRLHEAGMTVAAHTSHHVRLSSLDADGAVAEMRESKECVERQVHAECRHFAAPWGIPGRDFDPAIHPALARQIGFRSFLPPREGANSACGDPFAICRIGVRGFNWTTQLHCLFAAATHAAA